MISELFFGFNCESGLKIIDLFLKWFFNPLAIIKLIFCLFFIMNPVIHITWCQFFEINIIGIRQRSTVHLLVFNLKLGFRINCTWLNFQTLFKISVFFQTEVASLISRCTRIVQKELSLLIFCQMIKRAKVKLSIFYCSTLRIRTVRYCLNCTIFDLIIQAFTVVKLKVT